MPRASGLLSLAAALAVGPGCVAPFQCRDDTRCDRAPGGRCVEGSCEYGTATSVTSSSATGTSETSETSGTGEPASCEPWEVVLADTGKATGLALAPDGGVFVVGVTMGEVPEQLRVQRLGPDGALRWTRPLSETHGGGLDNDTDLWARVFVPDPTGEEIVVVYSRRALNVDEDSVKSGPHVHRIAAADGASLDVRDELSRSYRSLRGVSMQDAGSLLLAGEREDNIWYQSAKREGVTWIPAWADEPAPFAPEAGFDAPAIAQAIAAVPGAVMVGGSWDRVADSDDYSAWLRRLDPADGELACDCEVPGASLLAMAPAGDDGLFVAGFAQEQAQSRLWVAKLATTCPMDCAPVWQDRVPGKLNDTYFGRAELVRDAAFALAPLASGVLVGGMLDKKPWAARYSADGSRPWLMDPSAEVTQGAVLAVAVSADERCLTLAGSEDYTADSARRWWVRRVALPG